MSRERLIITEHPLPKAPRGIPPATRAALRTFDRMRAAAPSRRDVLSAQLLIRLQGLTPRELAAYYANLPGGRS